MSEVLVEDRTTPQRPAAPSVTISHARDKAVLRPVLDSERDATLVLPRRAADSSPRGPIAPPLALALKPGHRLHEYRIDGVLGEGGFGVTYLATDVHLDAAVAIKEYLPQDIVFRGADSMVSPTASQHLQRYKQGLESFLVEARTLASFRHPAIVRVARFFEAHHTAYMVLEVEKGSPLKAWWPEHPHIGEKALVELLLPLLDGLAAVHAAGFLHRDIKPDNIQVRESDGSLVLLDFGSAGLAAGVAAEGLVVVTPGYAPLEQYGLGEQGPWTDLYALGATLYWAVSGKKPPDAETRKADPKAYSRAVEAGRDVYGDAFLKAIDWALNTDPLKRPRTVAEFRRALCADHPASLERFETALRRNQLSSTASADETARAEKRAAARPRRVRGLMVRNWPLPVKLTLAMLLAAVLPMVVVAWSTLEGSVTALVQAESRYMQSMATRAAAEVSGQVLAGRRLTQSVAADPALAVWLNRPTEAVRAAVREKLQRLTAAGADVQRGMLLDSSGMAVLSSDQQGMAVSHALRPYFVAASAGRSYTSSLTTGDRTVGSGIYHSEPVRNDQGVVVGALVMRQSGVPVAGLLGGLAADSRLTTWMIDGDGVVVHHPYADLRYRSLTPLSDSVQSAVRADQRFRRDEIASMGESALARAVLGARTPGHLTYDSAVSGSEVVAGYAPVAGIDWVVLVSQPRSAVRAPTLHLQGWLIGGALLVALLMSAVAWWLARRLMRPVRAVTHALQELKTGDFEDARVKSWRGDELGELGRAFNALSDELRRRDRQRPPEGSDRPDKPAGHV